ncbi:MAG TPA: sigma-70 family RNA polymerase sigma factor [Zoogloea sp.]|uniref:sigma-70 family RNA polymerase sigma factor n=1 Tax=Zoogloea sp. TaxID=49181 RepID=UPI002D05DCBD|nr:sigma-70 family RNA polymerase sigma factor [Zoogloea sp.]HMV17410.1 sigma-70 family RNA polymerase sigma factor [Rhodocyclaceae bacterium]HMV63199.1 sigma-70 family RNA polymerase sigma factor [Rhodocyclaceae bacterium]HMW52199.1 sigma-70 family RNA polymerase sigma factor [Rhodocyclaceae bacterium]HMY48823.1 sigma-70 family RNA polymerase sigma factor [Rhodocyclaceae bacterium]HMZ75193.1 sigma-70 family RNA polymerase sigma factor [Rhodocyclaceae bacterium]
MIFSFTRKREFEQVVRAYSADLYRFAYWLCRDRFVAEDLVQESFARAWSNWDSLRDKSAPKPWLLTILRNEHARLYERKQFDYVDEQPEELAIAADHDPVALHELEDLIGRLPLSLREPFLLQTLGGFSCGEIAAQLDTTEGAVMVRLTRARQGLRQLLDGAAAPRHTGSAS